MATIKQIPSGKWQGVVVTPLRLSNGRRKRLTKTHPLKGVVTAWAREQESAIAAGTWLDPKRAAMTLGEWREKWCKSRIAVGATVAKNDSHWTVHIEPAWGGHPLGLITRADLKTWVKEMANEECPRCRTLPGLAKNGRLVTHRQRLTGKSLERAQKRKQSTERKCPGSGGDPGLGAWTIQGVVAHMSGLLGAAADDGMIPANPATRLDLPTVRPKPIFFWTRDEAAKIIAEMEGASALAVDLDMHIGLRPGELFGLTRRYVDLDRWQIDVFNVATRTGLRAHAKTAKSHRSVPVPKHLREALAEHVDGLKMDALVFPAPGGGGWDDRNFATRVFEPAVERAGVRPGSPYDMRHTAASWLVQAGVDLQRVQELLGHEKYSTTLRYAHLRPGAFGDVLDAWEAGNAS